MKYSVISVKFYLFYIFFASEPKWSHWSAWFQSGDNSYRFRFCDVSSMQSDQEMTCNGPNVETRPCKRHDVKKCTSPMGYPTEEYKYNCEGLDIGDVMATGKKTT